MSEIVLARDLASWIQTLVRGREYYLPQSLVYDNWGEIDASTGESFRRNVYCARHARLHDILFLRFAEPVTVFGKFFSAKTPQNWILEQTHPNYMKDPTALEKQTARSNAQIAIQAEVVLIARYGVATWGHWLGELLPKIVVVERFFPGRFRYILPMAVISGPEVTIWSSIRQSLIAYGITLDRCIPLKDTEDFLCDRLYYVNSVWSEFAMHPDVVALMRSELREKTRSKDGDARLVALLRTETPTRKISNLADVLSVLEREGYRFFEVGRMPFAEQISLFERSETVVAVLGSSLAGLIYAPEGVKVLSVAPKNFGDRFFYALVQNRGGRYADLRGQVTETASISHWTTFHVDVGAIDAALSVLNAT